MTSKLTLADMALTLEAVKQAGALAAPLATVMAVCKGKATVVLKVVVEDDGSGSVDIRVEP